MAFDPRIRSPKEAPLFTIGMIFSSLVWLVCVITIVPVLYGAFILLFVLAAHALFLAHVRGNGVRVSERQLPALHARVKAVSARLGLDEIPEVYVIQAGGSLNAFATKLFSRRFVVIFSDLIDNCRDERQLEFVLGHEIAHLAAGHLKWNLFLAPFRLVPLAGPAYSRACEYTCDRAGLHVVGTLEPAMRGLCVLAAGGRVAAEVDLNAFMEQREETGGFWMSVLELGSSHPYLCKRVGALQEVITPGSVKKVDRTILAYPVAPVLGAAAAGPGGMLVPVMIIGILASIAIPNFLKYQERAKEAQLQQQAPAFADDLGADGEELGEEHDDEEPLAEEE